MDRTSLLIYAATLSRLQLGEAVDCCLRAREVATRKMGGVRPLETRHCLSALLHSYSALEAVANRVHFEVFHNPDGIHYAPPGADDNEAIALANVERWKNVVLEKKVQFVLGRMGDEHRLTASIENELSDFRRYRHLVAHGLVTKDTALFGASEADGYIDHVVDEETDFDGCFKFPNLGLPRPDRLRFNGAKRMLTLVLRVIQQICIAHGVTEPIFSYELVDIPISVLRRRGDQETGPDEAAAILEQMPDLPEYSDDE